MDLPHGWSTRPAMPADATAIYELIAECERDLDGQAEIDLDDIVADLGQPSLDLQQDTLLIHDETGALAAHADVFKGRRAEADVRPSHRGRGVGAALLAWTEARARQAGGDRVGQTVTDNNRAAVELFLAHGYRLKDTAWILEIALAEEPELPPAPEGITVRAFEPGRDDRAAYQVVEEAFNEWPDRQPTVFAEWAQLTVQRETFAPALSPLAFDGDRCVGVIISLDFGEDSEGYVFQLAVDKGYRNRGIARTLLHYAFHALYQQGRRACVLSTNSYTGALTLYERVGMRIRRSYTHYERPIADRIR